MIDGAGGLDELFGPGDGFVVFDQNAKERRAGGDGGGRVEVVVFGGPTKCGTQIGQFGSEPDVCLALPGTVPQGEDVCFTPGEVAGMRSTSIGGLAASGELLLGELADGLHHREPG